MKIAMTESHVENETPRRPYYPKADFVGIKRELAETNWEAKLQNLNINGMGNAINSKIQELVEKYVPKTGGKGKRNKPWMDRGTLASVRKKHQLFRRWLNSQDGMDYLEYVRARNDARKACRKAQRKLEETIAQQAKKNPKAFWSYAKSKTNTKSGIWPSSMDLLKSIVRGITSSSAAIESSIGLIPSGPGALLGLILDSMLLTFSRVMLISPSSLV